MLEHLSGPPARSMAAILCLSEVDPSEAVDGIWRLVDYVARYLHQPRRDLLEGTWDELRRDADHVIEMVRAENGKRAPGAFDPAEEFT